MYIVYIVLYTYPILCFIPPPGSLMDQPPIRPRPLDRPLLGSSWGVAEGRALADGARPEVLDMECSVGLPCGIWTQAF